MLRPQLHKIGIANAVTAALLILAIFGVEAKREYSPPKECGLYLAPSTIPGAGLGMYAGSSQYEARSLVSDSDIMIPTWDLDYHNGDDDYSHLWDEYTWSAGMWNDPSMDASHYSFE